MSDDAQLLCQYIEEGSEAAFRELVERHIQLVSSTARRVLGGDVHLAQDVTQLVFTDLARKAGSLPPGTILGGWLHRHTCYTALKAIRSESRRRARERTAMEITALNESDARDAHWAQLAPVLDDALGQLDAEDRDAIVLRYLQQRDIRSIGVALGTSENAVQKRLGRALDKLHAILTRRGVTVSSVLLATALDAGAATAPVSAGLAATVSTAALSSAAATSTTLTLTTLTTMISSKIVAGLAAAIVIAGSATYLLTRPQSAPATAPVSAAVSKAPISSSATPAPATVASSKVEAPKVAAVPAGGSAEPADVADVTSDPFGPATGKVAGGQLSFASSMPGTVTINGSSGRRVAPGVGTMRGQVVAGANAMNGAFTILNSGNLGDPTSSVVNADGTMTNTYLGPNGETITLTQSPDGKAMMMSTKMPAAHFDSSGAPGVVVTSQGVTTSADGQGATVSSNDQSVMIINHNP
ncbi:MAG TPA: sigma-70 family RNA polymerase sigma factor [Opitutales bacterium]|nr:sigma-70 family RNA polymerase sigma factor [Opitutales bacterium]